jgi:hypothetical protein
MLKFLLTIGAFNAWLYQAVTPKEKPVVDKKMVTFCYDGKKYTMTEEEFARQRSSVIPGLKNVQESNSEETTLEKIRKLDKKVDSLLKGNKNA